MTTLIARAASTARKATSGHRARRRALDAHHANHSHFGELPALEEELFEWAKEEGYW